MWSEENFEVKPIGLTRCGWQPGFCSPGVPSRRSYRAERNQMTTQHSETRSWRATRTPKKEAVTRLCQLAARLGVPVISRAPVARVAGSDVLCSGMFVPHGSRGHRETRELVAFFHIEHLPVILLREQYSHILSHELGHAASAFSDFFDREMFGPNYPVSPLLDRVAARHGINTYCRSTRSELRAETMGRRLLGRRSRPRCADLPEIVSRFDVESAATRESVLIFKKISALLLTYPISA